VYGLGGNDWFEVVPPLRSGVAVNIYPGTGRNALRRPATAAEGIADITWHSRPDGIGSQVQGVTVEADPHPELTANARAWLRRYNLGD
jgi:hypothetical protein